MWSFLFYVEFSAGKFVGLRLGLRWAIRAGVGPRLTKLKNFHPGRHVVIGRLDSSLYLLMPRSDTRARECSIIYTKLRHALRMMTGLRCHRSADRLIILANCPFFRHSVSTKPCDILRYSCLRYTWIPSRAFSIPTRFASIVKRGCIRSRDTGFSFDSPPCAAIESLRFFFFPPLQKPKPVITYSLLTFS